MPEDFEEMSAIPRNNRIVWLDAAKGITILLMVIGHSNIPLRLSNFIWAFHMPFFFMVAGYCLRIDGIKGYPSFLRKKALRLLLPFFIYSLINVPFQALVSGMSILEYALKVIKFGWMGVPLWFIPVLFLALLVAYPVLCLKKTHVKVMLALLLAAISGVLCRFEISLPWDISAVPLASFFVMCGLALKQFGCDFDADSVKGWLLLVICFFVTAAISVFFRLDMCWNKVLPIMPIIVGALAGSLMVAILSMDIVRELPWVGSLLSSVGKETYVILAFSEIIIVLLNYYFDLFFVLKYGLLVIILFCCCKIKNHVILALHVKK